MTKKQTVTIYEKGPSLNDFYSGVHWAVRKKKKDNWRALVKEAVQREETEPVEEYPVTIVVDCVFGKGRGYDASNCAAVAKLIEDGLIKEGIIENDSPNYVTTVILRSLKGEEHKTVVTIIEEEDILGREFEDLHL